MTRTKPRLNISPSISEVVDTWPILVTPEHVSNEPPGLFNGEQKNTSLQEAIRLSFFWNPSNKQKKHPLIEFLNNEVDSSVNDIVKLTRENTWHSSHCAKMLIYVMFAILWGLPEQFGNKKKLDDLVCKAFGLTKSKMIVSTALIDFLRERSGDKFIEKDNGLKRLVSALTYMPKTTGRLRKILTSANSDLKFLREFLCQEQWDGETELFVCALCSIIAGTGTRKDCVCNMISEPLQINKSRVSNLLKNFDVDKYVTIASIQLDGDADYAHLYGIVSPLSCPSSTGHHFSNDVIYDNQIMDAPLPTPTMATAISSTSQSRSPTFVICNKATSHSRLDPFGIIDAEDLQATSQSRLIPFGIGDVEDLHPNFATFFGTNVSNICDIESLEEEEDLPSFEDCGTPSNTNLSYIIDEEDQNRNETNEDERNQIKNNNMFFYDGNQWVANEHEITTEEILSTLDGANLDNPTANFCLSSSKADAIKMLHELFHKQLVKKKTNPRDYITQLPIKHRNGCYVNANVALIPTTRKPAVQWTAKQLNERANLALDVIRCITNAADDEASVEKLLTKVISKLPGHLEVINMDEFIYSDEELAGLRSILHCSLRHFITLSQFERIMKGVTRFPTQLAAKLKVIEEDGVLPTWKTYTSLELTGGGCGQCLFWYVRAPDRMLEKMMESLIMSKSILTSDEISLGRLKNKLIVPFGCDKDTNNTSMLMRIANRRDGNSKSHVQALAMYEKGAENYENLKKTIFNENHPIKKFLQHLLDNNLFLLSFVAQTREGDPIECICQTLHLFNHGNEIITPYIDTTISEKQSVYLDENIKLDPPEDTATDSEFKCFHLDFDSNNTDAFEVEVQLVLDPEEYCQDTYVGMMLYMKGSETPFHSIYFPKKLTVPADGTLMINLQQVDGRYSADMKNVWAVTGMYNSASAHCSCPDCIEIKSNYKDNPPLWMSMLEVPEDLSDQEKEAWKKHTTKRPIKEDWSGQDAPLRQGSYCNSKLNKIREKLTNKEKTCRSKAEEDRLKMIYCKGIQKEPHLRLPEGKNTGGIMHGPHGEFNHFKDQLHALLLSVDVADSTCADDGAPLSWLDEVLNVKADCEEHQQIFNDLKEVKKVDKGYRNKINSIDIKLRKKTLKEIDREWLNQEKDKLICDRMRHSKMSGLDNAILLDKGSEVLLKEMDKYLNPKSKRARGPATHAFEHALSTYGGGFNSQHGGFEMTYANSINALDNWEEICDLTCKAYAVDDEVKNASIRKIMENSRKVATPMGKMCHLMKAQDGVKWTDDVVLDFKYQVARMYVNYLEMFPHQNVFVKLHWTVSHMVPFVEKYRMLGILSEESFEANHQKTNKEMETIASMPNKAERIAVLCRRLQCNMKPEVAAVCNKFESGRTGKARKKYVKRINRSKHADSTIISTFEDEVEDDIVIVAAGKGVKLEWHRVWDFVVLGIVPSEWRHMFESQDDWGPVSINCAQYTTH